MADATAIQIADAVTSALVTQVQAGTFSLQFEPKRTWMPDKDLAKSSAVLQVTLLPTTDVSERQSRSTKTHTYEVLIDVRRRVDPHDRADVDLLLKVCEEIADYLYGETLSSSVCIGIETNLDFPTLYSAHEFICQLTVSFLKQRTI